jgi:Peptidase_C39 like family
MPARMVPLAKLSLVYSRSEAHRPGQAIAVRRLLLWTAGMAIAAALYFGAPAFFAWKHTISSSGGHYFLHRVVIPVPVFTQDDPRWTFELLGPTFDTVGQAGCAITSAAMVLSAYGVDTDPDRLNQYLMTHAGYTENGWLYWEKAAEVAPDGQVEKAYEDLPSYTLIDQNLQAGNPVIVRLTLRNGTTHFVVVVGKEGWDYLVQDPARAPSFGVYPLKDLTSRIEALRFFRIVPPHAPIVLTAPEVGSIPIDQTHP